MHALQNTEQKVGSNDPEREALRAIQWQLHASALFVTLDAETIFASGFIAAQTGRIHGSKRFDPKSARRPCKEGAVHTWIASPPSGGSQ
jgi:hypothetical protein